MGWNAGVDYVQENGWYRSKPTGGSYTGPGNIYSFVSWYGLRGYSAAYSTGSNPAVDLVDQAGANTITINILSNGNLDVASINTWVTAHSVTTIMITKIYDQVGTHHLVQATLASMPVLTLNAIGSLPGMTFNGGSSSGPFLKGSTTVSQALPFTLSAAYKRVGNTASFGCVLVGYENPVGIIPNTTTNTTNLFAGSVSANVTAADNSFHAVQGLLSSSGTASSMYVDGTLTGSLSTGTTAWSSNSLAIGADNSGNRFFDGVILEAGYASGDQTANNSAINSNQHTYWGF